MRTQEQIETDYQQAALSLGHVEIQMKALEKNRQDLHSKIATLRVEIAEVQKVEAELAARQQVSETVKEEAKSE